MDKLQVDVELWHVKTFPNATNKAIINKAFEEMREFTAEAINEYDEMYEEAADVVIVLMALFSRNNRSLETEINKKLKINKNRIWENEDSEGGKTKQGEI